MSDDSYSVCPYNSQHTILTMRMPSHIIKCQKNYRGPPLEQCRYNATHLYPAEEMPKHELQCRDCYNFHSSDFAQIAQKFKR